MNAWCWKGQKRSSNPWGWLYKWLWATKWVLGIKPCSLAKATSVLNRWATSPAPVLFLFLSLLICLSLRLERASSVLCFEPVLTAQNKEVLEMFKVLCSIIWINLRLSSKLIFSRFEPNYPFFFNQCLSLDLFLFILFEMKSPFVSQAASFPFHNFATQETLFLGVVHGRVSLTSRFRCKDTGL